MALVRKSYVPGKGYVKAAEVGARVLRQAAKDRPEAHQTELANWAAIKADMEAGDKVNEVQIKHLVRRSAKAPGTRNTNSHRSGYIQNKVMRAQGIAGYMTRTGGKNTGRSDLFLPKKVRQGTINHEMAHGDPRRSQYRLHQIANDPKLMMREEGRAEMNRNVPEGYYRNPVQNPKDESGYTQRAREIKEYRDKHQDSNTMDRVVLDMNRPAHYSEENMKGFMSVQDRIAAARLARGREPMRTRDRNPGDLKGGRRGVIRDAVVDNTPKTVLGAAAGGAVFAATPPGQRFRERRAQRGPRFRGNQYMNRQGVHKSDDVDNDYQEEITNNQPSMFIDMPNSIRSLRVRDTQTGKFVPGSASLLASRFKKDADENSAR